MLNPDCVPSLKKQITGLLFAVIGQRLELSGLDNLEEGKRYLVVSNYPGSYAGFALMNTFPGASVFVHSFLARVPVVGFLLKSTGAVFVQRKEFGKTKRDIDEIISRGANRNFVILPEGGRSPDGNFRKFKRGFVYILKHSDLDMLPVTLSGFHHLKPLKRPYLDPDVCLRVLIHKPVSHSRISGMADSELLELTRGIIASAYEP